MRLTAQGLVLALALAWAPVAGASDLELDRVVAVVNNDVILASELERRMGSATVTKDAADPRKAMLWAMIDELLLVQLATESGLTASDTDVERAMAQIRAQNQIDRDQLLEELKKQGYSLSDYRRSVRHQILAYKIMNTVLRPNVSVTDAEAKALFDERVKAAGEKPVPEFDDVKDDLRQEIFTRRLDLARDRLALELRARAFIDVRLPQKEKEAR